MVLSSEMEQEDKPKWLLELENRKRKPRLAHEVGAGAPCIKCSQSCPGLDLHFWRKICKNCKCSRDDHDVPNDEFPQFDILFGKTKNQLNKKKPILLNIHEKDVNNKGEIFDWAPPDTTAELAADYMKALPNDKLPIKGTTGALLRKQQLQKQLPLHDIDHKNCDELSESERTQFERYLDNLKKYAGQGKVTKFVTAKPFDKSQMTTLNSSDYLTPKHQQSNDYQNINLRTPSSFIPETLSHDINRDEILEHHRHAPPLQFTRPGAELNNKPVDYAKLGEKLLSTKWTSHSMDNPLNNSPSKSSSLKFPSKFPITSKQDDHYEEGNSIYNDNMQPNCIQAQRSTLKNPDSHLIQSQTLSNHINPAVNFAQTNIYDNDYNNIDTIPSKSYPYTLQYLRSGGNSSGKLANSEDVMGSLGSIANKSNPKIETDWLHAYNTMKNKKNNSNDVPSYHNYLPSDVENLEDLDYLDYLISRPPLSYPERMALIEKLSPQNLHKNINDNKSLQAHYMPSKVHESTSKNDDKLNDNYDENSILADKILSDALLQPSSINSGDIIGSTLDQQGLNYIREKLTTKYSDKINSTELANLQMKNNSGHLNDSLTKGINAQLSSYGNGINPTIINSQEQNIQIFPDEITGSSSSRLMENPATDYLGLAMNNLSMIQKKVQNCHQCQEDIVVGDVVVTAEKAKDAAWHPGCFICSVCNELLVDLVYFYYKGKLYCGRDLAGLLEIPRCFACDELIFVRKYTVAEGHNYHVKHFCCWDCDLPLAGQQYISEDDKPLCLPCFKKLYAKTCNTCNGVIAPDQLGVAVKHLDFHATDECFCCAGCKKTLLNGKIAVKNDKPFCSKECIIKFE
ncbi:hypothetical protein HCN44_004210 [Aphidius gifuensis]|uniref:Testin n=1 Tax=Aphidius gifuensis TaxID=684658 RepID=A0A834XWE1_APHGI|nr:uncharacterized protein LOC122848368 [Aphidius gifuensis]KAF7994738.1 hypothetical protein HCN44_004210 [Aphidius gifuensis]